MLVSRVASRLSRRAVAQCRNSLVLFARQKQHHVPAIVSNQFHSLRESQNKVFPGQVSLLHRSLFNTSAFQQFGFSSSASSQPNKDTGGSVENNDGTAEKTGREAEAPRIDDSDLDSDPSMEDLVKLNNDGTAEKPSGEAEAPRIDDSDSDSDLSIEDLVKLVEEKDDLLKTKHKEIEKMQDKVLRTYAEMENVMARAKREGERSKKFAIQNFAKSLLDVADNLNRASSVVNESFSKIDTSNDIDGAVPILKTLLEGVEMTEKQLAEVFKKFGVEKYDPTNEQFDPHMHNALFQVPDPSKPPDTVAIVLKSGYMLHDRIIRPAEVGVTVGGQEAGEGSEA